MSLFLDRLFLNVPSFSTSVSIVSASFSLFSALLSWSNNATPLSTWWTGSGVSHRLKSFYFSWLTCIIVICPRLIFFACLLFLNNFGLTAWRATWRRTAGWRRTRRLSSSVVSSWNVSILPLLLHLSFLPLFLHLGEPFLLSSDLLLVLGFLFIFFPFFQLLLMLKLKPLLLLFFLFLHESEHHLLLLELLLYPLFLLLQFSVHDYFLLHLEDFPHVLC